MRRGEALARLDEIVIAGLKVEDWREPAGAGRRDLAGEVLTKLVPSPDDELMNVVVVEAREQRFPVPRIRLVTGHGRANSMFSGDHAITISFDLPGRPV